MKREEIEKNETKEMKQKSIVKKAKKIRSMVMMSLLCVLMLSAATYAWFTLSKTAKVSNMTMTVGDVTGLQIAPDVGESGKHSPGTYSAVLTFGASGSDFGPAGSTTKYNITGKLKPATTSDGILFKEPRYNDDGKVDGFNTENVSKLQNGSAETEEGFYYETTFYMKALGDGNKTIQVQLKDGEIADTSKTTGIADSEPPTSTGTYVLAKYGTDKSSQKSYLGTQAIRISLSVTDKENTTTTLIYQPNQDLHGEGGVLAGINSNNNNNVVAYEQYKDISTSKQDVAGSFTAQSKTLPLKLGEDTLVTMRIWIEGYDKDCVNEISLDNIIAQLLFEEVQS